MPSEGISKSPEPGERFSEAAFIFLRLSTSKNIKHPGDCCMARDMTISPDLLFIMPDILSVSLTAAETII